MIIVSVVKLYALCCMILVLKSFEVLPSMLHVVLFFSSCQAVPREHPPFAI